MKFLALPDALCYFRPLPPALGRAGKADVFLLGDVGFGTAPQNALLLVFLWPDAAILTLKRS